MPKLSIKQKALYEHMVESGEELVNHPFGFWAKESIPYYCTWHRKKPCPKPSRGRSKRCSWLGGPRKKDCFSATVVINLYNKGYIEVVNPNADYFNHYRFIVPTEGARKMAQWDF